MQQLALPAGVGLTGVGAECRAPLAMTLLAILAMCKVAFLGARVCFWPLSAQGWRGGSGVQASRGSGAQALCEVVLASLRRWVQQLALQAGVGLPGAGA